MENVAFYNYALTTSQVLNHYNTGTNFSSGPVTNVPSITTQPVSQTNYVGQTNTFTVGASGTAPLSYQWQVEANGSYVNLNNSGQFSGVTNATFSISSLALTNATNYEVVVTNSIGSVTSAPATLTVLTNTGAFISAQPVNQTNYVGQTSLSFTVAAAGGAQHRCPISGKWRPTRRLCEPERWRPILGRDKCDTYHQQLGADQCDEL